MTMNITIQEVIHDLIAQPGLGMFAWLCFVFFIGAFIIFIWALKSGQMTNIEDIKFEMLEDREQKSEVRGQNGESHA